MKGVSRGCRVLSIVLMMLRLVSVFLLLVLAPARAELSTASQRIDQLIDQKLRQERIEPNSMIDDATFLRRVSLDLIGRIPTLEEADEFFADAADDRREQLIDRLLQSEGYVSHSYHFWADILRINSRLGINETPPAVEYAYRIWLKRALRENLPYDEFVRQLVSARGHFWENGAVGYYHRDRGMPLDHMANTIRIFLGTRLECAQCHDHPFDRWTQMDFYQMAAFGYGMESKGHTHPNREALREFLEENETDKARAQRIRGAEQNLHVRVRYVTTREYDRVLQLPHDYQYSNAKPFDEVSRKAMFGDDIAVKPDGSTIEVYADWLTSKGNPTFTRIIANRLWSRLFGAGVFEPHDDLAMAGELTSNPELMDYLERLMRELDYDMRAFIAVVCKTQAYQRAAANPGEPYHFQGPLLRRMSAEQIWDSVAGLAFPEVDHFRPKLVRQLESIDRTRRIYEGLAGVSTDEYIEVMQALADTSERISKGLARVYEERTKAQVAGDAVLLAKKAEEENALRNELGKEISRIQKDLFREVEDDDLLTRFEMANLSIVTTFPKPKFPKASAGLKAEQLTEWREQIREEYLAFINAGPKWARASELESPSPRGHFLRDFGQSDRDTIENSSNQASIPQALNLLNGLAAEVLTNRFSVLGTRLQSAKTPEEKAELVFQALLTRSPNEEEMDLINAIIERDADSIDEELIWVLLNTRRFLFIQ